MATKNVLKSFRDATVLLSGQKYATLGISYVVISGLKNYLTTNKPEGPYENVLKQIILSKFDHYFGLKFISTQQIQASLARDKKQVFFSLIATSVRKKCT